MKEISVIIRNRRTVKPKAMKPGSFVPKEVVLEALENATWAPNHGHTEPWHFFIFSGESFQKFCEQHAEVYKSGAGDKFNEAKFKTLQNWYKTAAYLIAIIHRRNPQSRIRENEEMEAVACAVQNMALTIEAYGYAGIWSTGGATYMNGIRTLIPVEENDKMMGFFLIGEKDSLTMPGKRSSLNEKITWVP